MGLNEEGLASVYKLAISKWGVEAQVMMAFGEMSELMQALSKNYRGRKNIENIREEIADVEIMMAQLRIMFDSINGGKTIDAYKDEKITRLIEMLGDIDV